MPRIENQRIFWWGLWLCWNQNDRDERLHVRAGLTAGHAYRRTLRALHSTEEEKP